jgi:type II secretory pathway component PulF
MPTQYKYKAISTDGQHQNGTLVASNSTSVEEYLRKQDLLPIEIVAIDKRRPNSLFGFLRGTDYENIIMFTSSLATLNRAGIPLLRALSIIRIGDKSSRFNYALSQLRIDVQSGKALSEAMSRFPEIFSTVYVNCIAAGEESGMMDSTLDQLGKVLERESELTSELKAGIRYPLMVISAIVLAFVVIMYFVVPRFMSFYETFDAELPLPTRIIIASSNFVTNYWMFVLAGLIAIGFGIKAALRRKEGRLWFDTQVLRIPILGDLIIKGNIARFSLMFQILVNSGLTIVRSVDILSATIKNSAISQEIVFLGESFRRGQEINPYAEEFKYFPEQALHMLSIGLESGNLEAMLREVGDHYTKQVIHTSKQLTALIEPILTVVMGAFVLVLALAVFLPMWNLIKVFQH